MKLIIIFFVLQLINVILNTLKTLIMSKTDSKHAAAAINAITFAFYTTVVQQIGRLDLMVTIPVTAVTNIIGVYLSYWILAKFRKDQLWKIEVYGEDLCGLMEVCRREDIGYLQLKENMIINVYCYTQAQSEQVGHWIKTAAPEYNVHYNITIINKKF